MAYQSSHTGQVIDEAVIKISQLLDLFYPVGSIYISTKYNNPAATLGGTWTQIKDKFLLCSGDTYAAGATGGSTTHTHTTGNHTLTVAETPTHTHTRGTMEITGAVKTGWSDKSGGGIIMSTGNQSGAFSVYHSGDAFYYTSPVVSSSSAHNNWIQFTGSKGWTGETSSVGGGAAHSHGDTGSSSNLPPYKVVYAWERTA